MARKHDPELMSVGTLVQYGTLMGMAAAVVLWSQSEFASAGDVAEAYQRQSIQVNELFNESRMERLRQELEQLRTRQRAGYVYPDDADTENYLVSELERARDYEEVLREQKAQIK